MVTRYLCYFSNLSFFFVGTLQGYRFVYKMICSIHRTVSPTKHWILQNLLIIYQNFLFREHFLKDKKYL